MTTREYHDLECVIIARVRFYIQAFELFGEYGLLRTPQMPRTARRVAEWPAAAFEEILALDTRLA